MLTTQPQPHHSPTSPSDSASVKSNDEAGVDVPNSTHSTEHLPLPPPSHSQHRQTVHSIAWLYPEQFTVMNPLAAYPSPKFLDSFSRHIVELFHARIPELSTSDYFERVSKFFSYVCTRTPVTRGQLLHAFILLQRVDQAERKLLACKPPQSFQPLISEHTVGTLLLCSILISHKLNEDCPCASKYWSKLLTVTTQVLNTSEIVFLRRIKFATFVEPSELTKLGTQIVQAYHSTQ